MPKKVIISLLVHNHRKYLTECIERVRQQTYKNIELVISDNASTDGSREVIRGYGERQQIILNEKNLGFSAGHNRVIREGGSDYFMTLNPDLFMESDFVEKKVAAFALDERIGMVAGKILRVGGEIIDSTGMVLKKNRKNEDRGAGKKDQGGFDEPGWVFGIMGSEGMLKRKTLEDVMIGDEYFDEHFFAYREEADLSWRSQLRGWRCYYEPLAVARHVHEYATKKRADKSKTSRYLQFRNRYLMLMKNDKASDYLMHLLPIVSYEAMVFFWALLFEPFLLRGYWEAATMAPKMRQKRKIIQDNRKVGSGEILKFMDAEFIPFV